MKILYAFIIISLLGLRFADGQNHWRKRSLQVPPTVCYASDKTEKIYIPPPAEILLKSNHEKKSSIIVNYSLFPADGKAKAAFEYAVNLWSQIIESDIPIYIEANWRTIYDEKGNTNTILGQAGPSEYYEDFDYAPHKNRFYTVAAAEKITKSEISGSSSPDIIATFNKEIKWYYGTDGNTPDQLYDFVTVVLHELGHGLGFTGFFKVTGQSGLYSREGGKVGEVSAFDCMVYNNNKLLTDTTVFPVPSTNLYNAFISNNLTIKSPVAITDNRGIKPKLYAPTTFLQGSSIYHLDDDTYPATSGNSLMTHAIGKAEAIHDPGPITRGILDDVGWKIMKLHPDKPKDIEEKKPLTFNLSIESDYEIDSSSVHVYYSTNSFKNVDSILFVSNLESGKLTAILNPDFETGNIDYFISARDIKNRTFSSPSEAPSEYFSVNIGTDNQVPEINHTPIPYFVLNGDDIKISTEADDNLGVDTVFVEYWINNIPQQSFGLKHDSATTYSGVFNVDQKQLRDLDIFTYKITAIDSSNARNITVSPSDSMYSFRIEKIFTPVNGYYSDFNAFSNDFIISDFNIYTPEGFDNGALNSPHPYPSPDKTNTEFNFTTLLKYPVILNETATMSYDEVVLVEPGETLSKFGDDNFWDYVIAEGSKDLGKTWLPLAPGYDSGENTTWKTAYNKIIDNNNLSTTVGSPSLYINHEINMLASGNFSKNDTILIRFRLYSDPFARGWGWAIDNLRIQTPVSARETTLSPGNILIYPVPFSDKLNIIIQARKNITDLNVDIVNIYGQKIASYGNKNVTGEIKIEKDFSYLAKGMYIVIVKEDGNLVSSQKIVRK